MTTKERLHQLIDLLPDNEVPRIGLMLEEACASVEDEHGMTAEDRAWLDADLSDLSSYGPFDWGEAGPPRGKPVKYVPGVGLVILEEEGNSGDGR